MEYLILIDQELCIRSSCNLYELYSHHEAANMLFTVREIPWSQSFSFFLIQNNIFRAAKRKKTFEATVTWRYIPKN